MLYPAYPAKISPIPGICRSSLLLASLLAALPASATYPPSMTETNADELESIVITARRRKEKAQDVPAAISSVRGRSLEAQRIEQLADLSQALPGLTLATPGASGLSIRGSSASGSAAGGVTLYVDNVLVGDASQYSASLLDIQQVELLRGPQMLVGQSNSAGVLHVSTQPPLLDAQGQATIAIATTDYRQIKASYTAPIHDHAAFRIAGYGERESYPLSAADAGDSSKRREGLRMQGWITGGDEFQLRLIAEHHQQDSEPAGQLSYPSGLVRDPLWLGSRDEHHQRQSSLSAEAGWTLATQQRLTSISAWREQRDDGRQALEAQSSAMLSDASQRREQRLSHELRLASPEGTLTDYVLGAYWQRQQIDTDRQVSTGSNASRLSNYWPDQSQLAASHRQRRTLASLFAQSTVHLTPAFDVTAGAHLSREIASASLAQWWPGAPQSRSQSGSQTTDIEQNQTHRAATLAASYKPSEQTLLYVNLARGQSGTTLALDSLPFATALPSADTLRIAPETSTLLEAGIKTTWLNHRLYVNTSAFFNRIGGYQAWRNQMIGGRELAMLANAGDVSNRGLELDIKAKAAAGLTLALNASWNNSKFDRGIIAAAAGSAGNIDAQGKQIAGVPRLSLNSQMQYQWTLPNNIEPYLNASYSWRGEREGDASNASSARLPAYGVLNLSTGIRATHVYSRWDAAIWLKNAGDTRYVQTLSRLNQQYVATPGQRRMVGASVRYEF